MWRIYAKTGATRCLGRRLSPADISGSLLQKPARHPGAPGAFAAFASNSPSTSLRLHHIRGLPTAVLYYLCTSPCEASEPPFFCFPSLYPVPHLIPRTLDSDAFLFHPQLPNHLESTSWVVCGRSPPQLHISKDAVTNASLSAPQLWTELLKLAARSLVTRPLAAATRSWRSAQMTYGASHPFAPTPTPNHSSSE